MTRSISRDMLRVNADAEPLDGWRIDDARELYSIPHWGKGFFDVNEAGHLTAHPYRNQWSIDLKALVDQLAVRDIHPPLLVRFTDILRQRLIDIAEAFQTAIAEQGYQGGYNCVYPIKVNQMRHVVEEILHYGAEQGFGLEAGSKPELLAILALAGDRDIPMICNGFKDAEFIEMVILAQKLGKRVIPVVEKWSELELIVQYAAEHEVEPVLGVRVKLATKGSGKWETSGGVRSKFGLFITEVIDALDYLKARGMADALQLLHFHLGSQITHIRAIKDAVNELARVYVDLAGQGAGLKYIDIGGGMGVDYDGSQTAYESSINYTLNEYAADVVWRIKAVCDQAHVPHPTIISESGRAMVAYHSALIFDVLGATGLDAFEIPTDFAARLEQRLEGDDIPQPLLDLHDAYSAVARKTVLECYHDAVAGYEAAITSFNLGHLSLIHRGLAEKMFWATCAKIARHTRRMDRVPEELENLPNLLSDTYFCNFSVFQSLPDAWAIDQLFPILPIHRLNERPTRRGILADITCDSDGKVDLFAGLREDKPALELHSLRDGEPYYIGAFLIGAYQEILGDMHNLFGDTHVVHVRLDADGEVEIGQVVKGQSVSDMLQYVEFNPRHMIESIRRDVERAVKQNQVSLSEAARFMRYYEAGMAGYTYLEEPGRD